MAGARRKTSLSERKEIVEYGLSHDKNYKDTAARYDVSYSQVYDWVRKYVAGGEDGLIDRFHSAANCHQKGATHEPYQTKPRSCCSDAPCDRDGVFLGGQPFLVEREYQFPAPGAPFFSHDHCSSSSARRILQRPFLSSFSETYE